jgi:chitinase
MTCVRHMVTALALAVVGGACGGHSSTPEDKPPIAQAGFDRTVGKNAAVVLDGSTSADPEGRPLSYLWSLVSKPAGSRAVLRSATSSVSGFTADVPGVYVARLQVSNGIQQSQDEVNITSLNLAPVAAAGSDRDASRGVALALSGAGSTDPDGDPIAYQWTLVSRPPGSAATLLGAATATATLTPDLYGPYVVRLIVTDGELSSADEVTITARNHAPVANAGNDLESNVGATLALSAAASSDPDLDPIGCSWAVVSWPAGSAASLSDAVSCSPSVTFDVEGTYTFSLVVSDGLLESAANTVQVTVHRRVWFLDHSLVDAEYSRQLDRVVAVGADPARLYVIDPATRTETSVDLDLTPTSVSVSPDGAYAAVGHDAYVSYVKLSPLAAVKKIATTTSVFDLVLAGNGYVYAFPLRDQWEQIHCLDISSGAETLSTGYSIYDRTRAKLHPSGAAIYGADNGLSPSDIEKYGIGGGTAAYLYDSPYHGDYAMCGDLWISEDGLRIFTACGNTFHSTSAQETDMTYAGALEGMSNVAWIDHSLAAGLVLAVPRALPYAYPPQPNADAELRLFSDDFLALLEVVPLPRIGVGGQGFIAHGRFGFFSEDGMHRIAIVEVDASAGLLHPHAVVVW